MNADKVSFILYNAMLSLFDLNRIEFELETFTTWNLYNFELKFAKQRQSTVKVHIDI